MKIFKCTKEYMLLCLFFAVAMKWNYTQPIFWFAILLWGVLINMYERSVRKYIEEEDNADEL